MTTMETVGQQFVSGIGPCMDLRRSIDLRVQAAHDSRIGWKSECLRAVLSSAKKPSRLLDKYHPQLVAETRGCPETGKQGIVYGRG